MAKIIIESQICFNITKPSSWDDLVILRITNGWTAVQIINDQITVEYLSLVIY